MTTDTIQKIPIKQDLFRFVTLRGIEPISLEDKQNSFIQHPNISASQFVSASALKSKNTAAVYRKAVSPIKSYRELKQFGEALFSLSTKLSGQKSFGVKELEGIEPLKGRPEIALWDYLFFELIFKTSIRTRKALIELIKTNHFLKAVRDDKISPKDGLLELEQDKILIPIEVVSIIHSITAGDCDKDFFGVKKVGVIEYRKVEQYVCSYVPGEVSHIENVLAREYKEKHTRDLVRSEFTTEGTSEVEMENLSDTSTTTRNELNSEIEQTLSEERSSNYGGSLSVSANWTKVSIDANAYADFSNSNSSSVSNSVARNYAEEITRKTLEKIVRKTKLKRTSKIIKEFEVNNRHGFDNREGDEHVTGIYRWVDIIYTCKLVNYGKQTVYKFGTPVPSKFYKLAKKIKKNSEQEAVKNQLNPPKNLEDFYLNNFYSDFILTSDKKAIDPNVIYNLRQASEYFGITVQFPEIIKTSEFSLSYNDLGFKNETLSTPVHNQLIEQGYGCYELSGQFYVNYKGKDDDGDRVLSFFHFDEYKEGDDEYHCSGNKDCDRQFDAFQQFYPMKDDQMPCYFRYQHVGSLNGSFILKLRIKEHTLKQWQKQVYDALNQAYQQKLQDYENQKNVLVQDLVEQAKEQEQQYANHPLHNRMIEQRELKRLCIEMMMQPFCKTLGQGFTDERSCIDYKVPVVEQTPEFDEYIKHVQFFERAFDWDIMSYVFHPYYWAHCKDWVELIKTKNADHIFQAFLQAGLAEVMVPVKCEMTDAVAYYFETGDVESMNSLVADDPDDQNCSISNEMNNCHEIEEVERAWDLRVLSTLTILQKDSALINEKGLPQCLVNDDGCCDRMEELENTIDAPTEDDENMFKLLKGKSTE